MILKRIYKARRRI